MPYRILLAFAVASPLAVLGLASAAHAQSLRDCGNIHVEAEATCKVEGGVSCEAMCEPVSVRAACSATLQVECSGLCTELPTVECQGSCEADCHAECDVDPGKFDCAGSCQLDCEGDCAANCAVTDDAAQCQAACEASCGASCQGKCEVEPPEASCDAKCSASCSGSCEAKANLACQVDCQSQLYGKCETEVQGGCEADCKTEQGALFCDGQYVDHGDHLDKCVSAIEAYIDANVEGYAEGSSSCGGGMCMAEGEAGVSCSARPGSPAQGAGWLMGLALGALALVRRRR